MHQLWLVREDPEPSVNLDEPQKLGVGGAPRPGPSVREGRWHLPLHFSAFKVSLRKTATGLVHPEALGNSKKGEK